MCSVWVDCIVSEVFMNSVLSAGIKLYLYNLNAVILLKQKLHIPRACDLSVNCAWNEQKMFFGLLFFALILRRTWTQLKEFHCMTSTSEQVCSDIGLNDQWK
jgi:hypothetical protein